ncbi:glycosyltransferase family 4 protein [Propionicimonas sp.]|uniref:glycosyltransferase family 4 protein n=1 Tax=Propionicimonas sp. TaxID=1955623 RepID=UPI0039E4DCFC
MSSRLRIADDDIAVGEPTPPLVVFLDHTSILGGAELGLCHYFERPSTRFRRALTVVETGPLVARAKSAGVRVEVLARGPERLGLVRTVLRLRRRLEEIGPDVVIANSLRSTFMLALALPRKVFGIAYVREDLTAKSLGPMKRAALKYAALPLLGAVIANSEWTLNSLGAKTLQRVPHAVAYPVSGIETANARPATGPEPQPVLRVLSLSRLYEWKGIHILVEAAALLGAWGLADRFVFTIAGDEIFGSTDDYANRLRRRAAEINAEITFAGHLDDVRPLLASHDVLAHCSITPEAFGQVIPQAMAYGLAVIATRHGGPLEIISDGQDGILVSPGDPVELAQTLADLLQAPERVRSIGQRATASANRFSDARTVPELERTITSLWETRGRQVSR